MECPLVRLRSPPVGATAIHERLLRVNKKTLLGQIFLVAVGHVSDTSFVHRSGQADLSAVAAIHLCWPLQSTYSGGGNRFASGAGGSFTRWSGESLLQDIRGHSGWELARSRTRVVGQLDDSCQGLRPASPVGYSWFAWVVAPSSFSALLLPSAGGVHSRVEAVASPGS